MLSLTTNQLKSFNFMKSFETLKLQMKLAREGIRHLRFGQDRKKEWRINEKGIILYSNINAEGKR